MSCQVKRVPTVPDGHNPETFAFQVGAHQGANALLIVDNHDGLGHDTLDQIVTASEIWFHHRQNRCENPLNRGLGGPMHRSA